jgi:isopenicillin N synthase-like dioxygenase
MDDIASPAAINAQSADETYLMDHPDSTEEIPILDIAPALSGGKDGLASVARELRRITETIGFFYLKGHGVPQDLVDPCSRSLDGFIPCPPM